MLFEMMTGTRPFQGDTPTSVLSSILKDTPPAVAELNPEAPRELSKLIKRCLAKAYYLMTRDGTEDLWHSRIDEDGSPQGAPERLTAGVGMRSVDVSVDGSKIAYSEGRRIGNLWRVPLLRDRPATWADAEALTSDQLELDKSAPSPDGKRLVVQTDRSGNWDLWLLELESRALRNLTNHPAYESFASWSPDGSAIVFGSDRSGNWDLWSMSAAGGSVTQLTDHPAYDSQAEWSPDGKSIVFVSGRSGTNNIWVTSATGTNQRPLTDDGFDHAFPQWSPYES